MSVEINTENTAVVVVVAVGDERQLRTHRRQMNETRVNQKSIITLRSVTEIRHIIGSLPFLFLPVADNVLLEHNRALAEQNRK